MSIALLESAAAALAELTDDVVFVGGATVGLWITDPAAPAPRPTKDVDVIVEVASRRRFAQLEQRLREHGFREDRESGVICRWVHGDSELVLDAMPLDASILGFANRGQAAAVPHAVYRPLPSGAGISARVASVPARDEVGGVCGARPRRLPRQPRLRRHRQSARRARRARDGGGAEPGRPGSWVRARAAAPERIVCARRGRALDGLDVAPATTSSRRLL